MAPLRRTSVIEQAAAHIREDILAGKWQDYLPGKEQLATDLGISSKTVAHAVELLEKEGLVNNQGKGRRKRVVMPDSSTETKRLLIAILRFENEDNSIHYVIEFLHRLREAGHQVVFADKSQTALKMDVKRVAKVVENTQADAWVVISGSDDILEWFASQAKPCFGLFGYVSKLPIAGGGPAKKQAYEAAATRLIELGHRRITLLARWVGQVSGLEVFYEALEAKGIEVGHYNMPRFEDTRKDFHRCLNSLFATTPPTAIVAMNVELFLAVQQFLARRKLLVPEDASLICADTSPDFNWCDPTIAHISWDNSRWMRRIVDWADNISMGKPDTRKAIIHAKYIDGGTVGPAL